MDHGRRLILLERPEVGQLLVDVFDGGSTGRSGAKAAALGGRAVGLALHPSPQEKRRDAEDRDDNDDRGEVPRLELELAKLGSALFGHAALLPSQDLPPGPMKALRKSTGTGRMIVEFFSAAISVSVWR